MIIRKQFKFESAHIVRNAVSERCKFSIHGHSYRVEVFLHGKVNQETGMLLDFIEFKKIGIADFLDKFDHAIAIWNDDSDKYIADMLNHSKRAIIMNLNPTAENMAIFFHYHIQKLLGCDYKVKCVRVHETDTGYAESEETDLDIDVKLLQFDHT